jgi:peroxiredoxin
MIKTVFLLVFLFMVFSLQAQVRVGERCPDLSFGMLNGETKKISDFLGSTVFVHFCSATDDSCLRMIPELVRLNKKHGKFVILAVYDGNFPEDSLQDFIKKNKINYSVAIDRKSFLYKSFTNNNQQGLPYNVLVDNQGIVYKFRVSLAETEDFLETKNPFKKRKQKKKL